MIHRRASVIWVGLGILSMTMAAIAWSAGCYVNVTSSIPLGLYRRVTDSLTRGGVVRACLPLGLARLARQRRYIPRGACPGDASPVGKYVYGLPGDTVAFSAEGVRVDGRLIPNTEPLRQDAEHRPLVPFPFGTAVIAPGTVLLLAPHPKSLDGRYTGPVSVTNVLSQLRPIWAAQPKSLDAAPTLRRAPLPTNN